MRVAAAALFVVFAPLASCQKAPSLPQLHQDHRWFAFRDAVRSMAHPTDFERGVVACTFHDVDGCERYMQRVFDSGAAREEKAAAHVRLAVLYTSLGRTRLALPHLEAVGKLMGSAASGADAGGSMMRAYAASLDMSVTAFKECSLPDERRDGHPYVPVTVNGAPGSYILDTGAGYSAVTESEAKRVGMRLLDIAAMPAAGFSGATAPVTKVAIVENLELGQIRLRNVPFLVLPDADTHGQLPPGSGALGVQVLVACRTIRWDSSGLVQLGFPAAGRLNPDESNLCFDDHSLRAQAEFSGRKLDFKLDTGAFPSYLLDLFAKEFPAIVKESGHPGSWSTGGFGAAKADVPATLLPQIELKLGPQSCTMRPAPIVRIPGAWGHGSLGFGIFKNARAVTLDFQRMMLIVE